MTTGIVIVSYKCRDLLVECIGSVEAFVPELLQSLVVVDNASGDGTTAAVRRKWPAIKVLENQRNLGFSAAVNEGLEALRDCDVVCLLNPDSVLLDDGIRSASDYLCRHTATAVLGGRILNTDGSLQASARAFPGHLTVLFNRHSLTTKFLPSNRWSRRYLMTGWKHDDVRAVDWVSGAFMFIHRRAFDSVGPFDEGYFFSIEDVDFCRRVRDAGLEVEYFPAAAIRHRVGGSSRNAVYRAMAAHHSGMWRYYRKHLRGGLVVDVLTASGITARFGLHAVSYALRTLKNRLLGRPNP